MFFSNYFFNRALDLNIETLKLQSRSFAIPILKLDTHLLKPIMVEYNLNKTLDTIEDCINLSINDKKELINTFCTSLEQGCLSAKVRRTMLKNTFNHDNFVFKNYGATIHLYNLLPEDLKAITLNRTYEMAKGMVKFLDKKITSVKDLNQYCYFVAGTVGIYLTEIIQFYYPIDADKFETLKQNAIGFGLFLQKLNIIRDHLEDQQKNQGSYWPEELFIRFKDPITALNFLCYDAVTQDATRAVQYFADLPHTNDSFNNFIKYLLYSGLEYIKLLKNNSLIFTKLKVKLPKAFIVNLYQKISKINKSQFLKYCQETIEEEVSSYNKLLSN